MEDAGAQVAPSLFIHQTLANRFHEAPSISRKRDLPFQSSNFQQQQRFQNSVETWNPKAWNFDSVTFLAKQTDAIHQQQPQMTKKDDESRRFKNRSDVGAEEGLMLKLGGTVTNSVDEPPVSRPSKRVRSRSPGGGGGGGGSYPKCQVDNCREDLSNAKDYHRRHKVCEVHSKSIQALVTKQMQRFCQQCSRFHPLSEFDEGKRSCRRRLAGHNRRRRKTQPEDVTSRLLPSGNNGVNSSNGNLDVVNLLTVLARAQGNIAGNNGDNNTKSNCTSIPDKDQLIQILSKINSLPLPNNFSEKLPYTGSSNMNIPEHASLEHQNRLKGNTSSPSTMNLLACLSSTVSRPTPNANVTLSHRGSQSSDSEKTHLTRLDEHTSFNLKRKSIQDVPSAGGESSTSYQSPIEDSDCQIQETRVKLPLQLFSPSPENDSPPKLSPSMKYFSSGSSNPMEERSPSSSPPVVQKLFPVCTSNETVKPERMSVSGEHVINVAASRTQGCSTSFELFRRPRTGVDNQNIPYQAGYTSSSGSDHSPSSFSSAAQDRTGRLSFKLFDKDPSHLPATLRTEIFNWLSQSPSEMESYIRPGCVVLSVYISMSSAAWEQLEENILPRVNSLVQNSNSDFWRNGRFLFHAGRRLAIHKDGNTSVCKSWRTWTSPELTLVSPLAIVAGQETSLLLRGRNLTAPGTRVHCTHMGGYTSHEVQESDHQGTIYDEINLSCLKIQDPAPSTLGRCFIEVENGLKGNSFPVIIANAAICRELRLLESEFDEDSIVCEVNSRDQTHNFEEVLHFLNELGWLFQRSMTSSRLVVPNYTLARFKFLFSFSVDRDYCALVKTLLDILVEGNSGRDGLSKECFNTLNEVHLLSRAVKRRCREMVDLLINYTLKGFSKKYIFVPNLQGPGGVSPLHLVACTSGLDDMVDALTSDPQQIGMHCWHTLLDSTGQSPYAYASIRNNHSYNTLVARKLADKRNSQISLSIESEIHQPRPPVTQQPKPQFKNGAMSCARCANITTKYGRNTPGSHGLLHRPFVHSMLAIAAVCVCVCVFMRGYPDIGVENFKWENLDFGTS